MNPALEAAQTERPFRLRSPVNFKQWVSAFCVSVSILMPAIETQADEMPRELFPYGFGGLDEMPVTDAVDLVMGLGYTGIVPDVSQRTQNTLDRLESYLDSAESHGDAFSVYAVYLNHKVYLSDIGYDDSFHRTVIDILAERGGGTLWMAVRAVRQPDSEFTDYVAVNNFIKGVFEYATGEDATGVYRNVNIVFYPHINNAYVSATQAMTLIDEIDDPRFTISINLIHEYHAGLSDPVSLANTFQEARGHIGAVILGGIQTTGDFSILSLEESELDLVPYMELVRDSEYTGPVGFINFMIPEDLNDGLDYPEDYLTRSMNEWGVLTDQVSLYKAPEFAFVSSIGTTNGNLNMEWTSQLGRFYDIISSTDLMVPRDQWMAYDNGETTFSDIPTSGVGLNSIATLGNITGSRFFTVREKIRPD